MSTSPNPNFTTAELTTSSQFGNMLVLTAIFASGHFEILLPEAEYHRLLGRTIAFLRRISAISPTCSIDCSILEKLNGILPLSRQGGPYDHANPVRSEERSECSTDPSRHVHSPAYAASPSTAIDGSKSAHSSRATNLGTNHQKPWKGNNVRERARKACDFCFVRSKKVVLYGFPSCA